MMISVDGYKAFHGCMQVSFKSEKSTVVIGPCDWIYIPERNSWICNDYSFNADECTPILQNDEI